jgi:NAD(P)-dependent dehydrogenase (short-subunit alcohol dehydrogenase family)
MQHLSGGQGASSAATALVTGANRGIGTEVCRQLAARGYRFLLTARDRDKAAAAARSLDPAGQQVVPHVLDVADQGSVGVLADRISTSYGRLDVLINNAAISYDTWATAATADLTAVHEAFETNLFGAWRASQACIPLLRASLHPRIVNVSSEAGSISEMTGGTPAYSVSKAALNALTRLLAGELRPAGILVNAVCPGWVATDMGGPGGRPVAEGAASVLWAATLPDTGPTGGFFRDGQPVPW